MEVFQLARNRRCTHGYSKAKLDRFCLAVFCAGNVKERGSSVVSQKFIEEQLQILRLTTPRLKSTPRAPFAQDDSSFCVRISDSGH